MAAGHPLVEWPATMPHGLVRRRTVVTLALVVVLAHLIGFTVVQLVRIVWPRTEQISSADAVVVFAGGEHESRETRAVSLIVDELAGPGPRPVLVLSLGSADTVRHSGIDAICERASRRILPAPLDVEVMCIVPDPANTSGEAAAFGALAERHGWDRLVGVSSQYHVERVAMWLERCSTANVKVASAEARPSVRAVIHELGGIVYATTMARSCPDSDGVH